ncbi:hypothetical protein GCM10008994_20420 [Halorubrum ejinorense]|uniref:Uncharacterized protein n=1 Tax=Halorubrum ejinorense TaxID=425309 RepID=A0AAV3STQ8_9EURY
MSAFGGLLAIGFAGVVAEWYSWPLSVVTTTGFVAGGMGIALYQSPLLPVPHTGELAVGAAVAIGLVSLGWWCRESSVRRWISTHQDAIVLFGVLC